MCHNTTIMGKTKSPLLPSQEKILETVGTNIKLARLRRDLSTEQVAERAGIGCSTPVSYTHLIDDACRLLGKAKQTVYALACRGEIPNYKQGRTVYFFEDELLEWIASGKVKTNEELRAEAQCALYKGTRR